MTQNSSRSRPFFRPNSPLLHCEIRKLQEDESLHTHSVQPTRERGPEVFPHPSSKNHKTKTPPAPLRCATSWLHTFGLILCRNGSARVPADLRVPRARVPGLFLCVPALLYGFFFRVPALPRSCFAFLRRRGRGIAL